MEQNINILFFKDFNSFHLAVMLRVKKGTSQFIIKSKLCKYAVGQDYFFSGQYLLNLFTF